MSAPSTVSTSETILSALRANNPFERPPVVKEQNVWGESFPDILSLNAKASDSVFSALKKLRDADSTLDKVTSIVFTSNRGVGKSHIIRRIRKRLQATGEGVFVYSSADKYGDLNLVNALFRQSVADSLEQLGSEGVTQWQEIAVRMVAEAVRANNPKAKVPAAPEMVNKFDRALQARKEKGRDLVSDLVREIRKLKPKADVYIIRAIVWTLSEEWGAIAVKWLAGEQVEAQDAIELRLPSNNQTEEETNAAALSISAQIISLVGEYKSVVVCFDELDTLAEDEIGYPTEFVILDLVKRLFGALTQSERGKGIAILTVILPALWSRAKLSRVASAEKISSYGEPINLEYLDAGTTKDLAAITLKRFYSKRNLTPPTPIYPFEEEELESFGKNRLSPREALKWFASELNKKIIEPEPETIPPKERFNQAYENALSQFGSEDLSDNSQIAQSLRFGFQKILDIEKLKSEPIEGVILMSIEEITPRSKNGGYLHFKVVGEEDGERVSIGICVLQSTNGRAVGAGFKRLLETETFGLSRGCLVRSRDLKIQRNWDSYEYYQQLVSAGGEWVDLKEDQIKPLLALQYVYEHHDKFDLTIKRLDTFAFVRNLLQNSPLIREILSRPEGMVAEEALEGDAVTRSSVNPETVETDLAKVLSLDEESEADDSEQPKFQEFDDVLAS